MKLSEARECRFEAFRQWLKAQPQLSPRAQGDADSRARRVERDLFGGINLDAEYVKDQLARVLQALEYSAEDVHDHKEPPAGLVFKVKHDNPRYYEKIKEGLNSLHTAVGLYRDFCVVTPR